MWTIFKRIRILAKFLIPSPVNVRRCKVGNGNIKRSTRVKIHDTLGRDASMTFVHVRMRNYLYWACHLCGDYDWCRKYCLEISLSSNYDILGSPLMCVINIDGSCSIDWRIYKLSPSLHTWPRATSGWVPAQSSKGHSFFPPGCLILYLSQWRSFPKIRLWPTCPLHLMSLRCATSLTKVERDASGPN